MEPVSTTAVLTAAGGVFTALTTQWLKVRVQRWRWREESRREHVRGLPAGSRVVDLGERGIVIEVGQREGRAGGSR